MLNKETVRPWTIAERVVLEYSLADARHFAWYSNFCGRAAQVEGTIVPDLKPEKDKLELVKLCRKSKWTGREFGQCAFYIQRLLEFQEKWRHTNPAIDRPTDSALEELVKTTKKRKVTAS